MAFTRRILSVYGRVHSVTKRLLTDTRSQQYDFSHSLYGGRHTITLIPGDGIGPELAVSVKEVFRHANVPVEFEEISISGLISSDHESIVEAVTSIKRNGVAIKGVLHTPLDGVDHRSLNMLMRLELDLFANVVLCKSFPGIKTRHEGIDIAIIRENTEGEYSGLEHESVPGVVESLKIITKEKSRRIAKYAFDYATRHKRSKVTAIHKANIMKLTDGLFLRQCKEVSELYPNINFDSMIIDNCCMQMVSNPNQFDVMVMPNLYGNIVSNIGAGLVGGAGLVAGKNVGTHYVLFEPGARHTALSKASQNICNPTGILMSGVSMLHHIGLHRHGVMIQDAIMKAMEDPKNHTHDLGGTASTSSFIKAVVSNLNTDLLQPEQQQQKI